GVETVRAAVRTDRATVRGGGAGAGQTSVGGWQLRGGQRSQGEPDSAGAVSGSSTGPSHREPVSEGSGSAKPGGGTGARARSGINHRPRRHLRHQGRHAGTAEVLRQLSGRQ